MKLNITMTIKAIDSVTANNIVMRELYELARNAGCMITIGNGDANVVTNGVYQFVGEMMLPDNGKGRDAVMAAQRKWTALPTIINSHAYVSEEKQETNTKSVVGTLYTCKKCGHLFHDENGCFINPGMEDDEHFLCDKCLEEALDEGDVELCEVCGKHVSAFVENPVTHKKNICPICGNTLFF